MDLTPEELERLLNNQRHVIEGVKHDYPDLKGPEIVDQSIHRLNKNNHTDRYGRKARQSDGGNPNDDVITIRLDDDDFSQKKLIDVLGNANPHPDPEAPADVPMWGVVPAEQEPGNGFWTPAVRPDLDQVDPPDPPQPGEINVLILDYDKVVRRSDPHGLLIRFEVEDDQPVTHVWLDLVEDGEDAIPITFSQEPRKDGRYVRALAFKPTINGDFTLRVTATDAVGRQASADGPVLVRVQP